MAKDKKKPETKQETPPFPSRDAAMDALEKSTLSDAEKARLMQKNGSTITVANLPPDEVVRGNPETSPKSGAELAAMSSADRAWLSSSAVPSDGINRVEREPLAPVADVVRGDALLASMGDAAKRLETEASKGIIIIDGKDISPEDRERMLADAKKHLPPIQVMHLHSEDEQATIVRLRPLARPGETLAQAVERLEALARAVSAPAVGLIVQETAPSLYKVHVVESDAEGVRVWDTEPGKAMPWHAAKVLVDRVVETKLTPEDKR